MGLLETQIKAEQKAREMSQNSLNETGSLLSTLEKTQRERLSKTPPPHLAHIMHPSDTEMQLGISFHHTVIRNNSCF